MERVRRYGAEDVEPGEWWADHLFIAAHMRPVGARDGDVMLQCRFYDRERQACGAYDSRPPLCRGYPWYGREPSPEAVVLDRQCSFWADIPAAQRPADARPLIPLAVVTGG